MKNTKEREINKLRRAVRDIELLGCPACGNVAEWTFQPCDGGQWNPDGVIMAFLGCKTFKCLQVMPQQVGIEEQLFEMAEIWNRRPESMAVGGEEDQNTAFTDELRQTIKRMADAKRAFVMNHWG